MIKRRRVPLSSLDNRGQDLGETMWEFRLYIAGQTVKSLRAIANMQHICEDHLAGQYRIEVIDLSEHPELARFDDIVALPTLVRRLPRRCDESLGTFPIVNECFSDSRYSSDSAMMRCSRTFDGDVTVDRHGSLMMHVGCNLRELSVASIICQGVEAGRT